MKKRYQKIAVGAVVTAVLAVCAILYGYLIEARSFVIRRVSVEDDALAGAWGHLRIVHISDLHMAEPSERELEIVRQINLLGPDMVCVSGDLGQWGARHTGVVRFLRSLEAAYGVFVVLGDSDATSGRQRCFYCHQDGDIHRLRDRPRFLRDQCLQVAIGSRGTVDVCGIDPATGYDQEKWHRFYETELKKRYEARVPVLLISHFSSPWESLPDDLHILWLAGNTHGGQIWTPSFLRPFIFRGKDFRHLSGLFASGRGKWLYVNPGLGTTEGFPVRIGVRPEITVIDIGPKRNGGVFTPP